MERYSLASSSISGWQKAYLSHIRGLIHPIPASFLLHHPSSFPRSTYRINFGLFSQISRND
jgi:hypothetical protein